MKQKRLIASNVISRSNALLHAYVNSAGADMMVRANPALNRSNCRRVRPFHRLALAHCLRAVWLPLHCFRKPVVERGEIFKGY